MEKFPISWKKFLQDIDVGALLKRELYSDHFLGKYYTLKRTTTHLINKNIQTQKPELEIIR